MVTAPIKIDQEAILRLRQRRRRVDIKDKIERAVYDIESASSDLSDAIEELDGIGTDRSLVLAEIDKFLERVKFSLTEVTKDECIDFIKELRKDIAP